MTGFLNYAWLPHDQRSADISDRCGPALLWQLKTDVFNRMFWSPSTMAMRDMCFNFFVSHSTGVVQSGSIKLTCGSQNPQYDASPEWYEALERVGFSVDTRGDFMDHLLVRFGKSFISHGSCPGTDADPSAAPATYFAREKAVTSWITVQAPR